MKNNILAKKMEKLQALQDFEITVATLAESVIDEMQATAEKIAAMGVDKSQKAIAKEYAEKLILGVKYASGNGRKGGMQ